MFTSGSHKMLKILIEIIVQVFLTIIFFAFLFFRLGKFRTIYRFNDCMLRLLMDEKSILRKFESKTCFSLDGTEKNFYDNSFVFSSTGFDPKFVALLRLCTKLTPYQTC